MCYVALSGDASSSSLLLSHFPCDASSSSLHPIVPATSSSHMGCAATAVAGVEVDRATGWRQPLQPLLGRQGGAQGGLATWHPARALVAKSKMRTAEVAGEPARPGLSSLHASVRLRNAPRQSELPCPVQTGRCRMAHIACWAAVGCMTSVREGPSGAHVAHAPQPRPAMAAAGNRRA